ncbi:MAG: class I SAM-dependent methyltransferase [Lachnospiraceae bacterium]|nr:class I SAM-dependent methyltransferase [Lachnospiraceae bacterium]
MALTTGIGIYTSSETLREEAEQLADKLDLPLLQAEPPKKSRGLLLRLEDDGLSLTDGNLFMKGDLTSMLPRLKQNNLNRELLVKAAKKNGEAPLAVDATAGMGEDALLLAASGFRVLLFEYDPVIAALLADSLKRASEDEQLSPVVSRMTLISGDSIHGMQQLSERPAVILLDPMFPKRQKSGLIKKKFQLLQQLESPCSSEDELFGAAIAAAPGKIIVKRPAKGPFLSGKKPSYSLKGSAIRYDCYVYSGA